MKRRAFITLLGSAVAWPLAARAQRTEQVRRLGVLMSIANDSRAQRTVTEFLHALQALGWTERRNLRIDYRWAAGDAPRARAYARELIDMMPDVIHATGTPSVTALQRASRTIPIVFVHVADPVGDGFVTNLARPGGNITGFTNFEPPIAGKWVQLLKDIAPHVTRLAIISTQIPPLERAHFSCA